MTSNHAITAQCWTYVNNTIEKISKQHFWGTVGFHLDPITWYDEVLYKIGNWKVKLLLLQWISIQLQYVHFVHNLIKLKLICIVVTYAKSESRRSGAPLQTLPYPYKNLFHVSHYSLQNLINYIISWQHDSSRNLKTAQSSTAFGWFTSFTTFVETS